jgi:hypothetical protein
VRRLLTLGQPHRNTAIRAHLQSRRALALLVVLVLCLSAFVLAANEAWAKEQPSPAAQRGPAEGKNTPNGQANGQVAEPVSGTPTPSLTPPVAPPAFQGQPAVTPPVQTPPVVNTPVETAPPPPKSETPPPAEKPSSPPLEPVPSTPEPDAAPQPTPQPAPQAGGEEDVEYDPVPHTSQRPMTGSDRVVEPEPVSTASPNIVDKVVHEVIDLAPAPATPATADEGHTAGPAPDPVLPLPALAAASDQVLPAASEGLAALVRGLVTEPATAPATAPIAPWAAPWGGDGPLTTITNNKPAAAFVAAAVPAAPAVGEALRLSSSLGTRAAGALGSTMGTIQSAATSAARAATSVASATAEVFRALAGGSAGTPSSSTDATSGTQQAPSGGAPQDPVAPLAPPLGDSLFSPFTGAAGQLGGGGVAPLLVGILALLTVTLTRRDFRTYLIACEMPKPSSALLRPLERPG